MMLTNSQRAKYFKDKKIIGIDPGSSSGAICVFSEDKDCIIEVVEMGKLTPRDIHDILAMYKINSTAYMERVGGLPGQSGSAAFRFGQNVGHVQMSLLAHAIPMYDELPQIWQKAFRVGVRGNKSKTEWKKLLKAKAQQLYPKLTITNAMADAILIMEYGRQRERGNK